MYCWIGVGRLAPPDRPTSEGRNFLTLEDLWSCVNRRVFSQSAISGTMVCAMASAYDALLRTSAARGSLRTLSSRRELDVIHLP